MSMHDDEREQQLDEATARRLAKLRTMPVETRRLEQLIRAQIPPVEGANGARGSSARLRLWGRPLRAAIAALVVLGVGVAFLVTSSGGPAMASTDQMTRMHDDLVSGRVPVEQVASMAEANRVLAAKSTRTPALPTMSSDATATQPDAHVMACCLKSVKNKKVACVLLKSEGVPVTMAVADAADLRSPRSPTAVHDGITFHVQSSGALNMVMSERDGRWVCMIAELPSERLMELAAQLKF